MRLRAEIFRVVAVVVLVATLWCYIYHRYNVRDWKVPNNYSGDTLFVLAWTKAAQEGEFLPIVPKMNRYLGAPFVANWNDFPLSEDMIFCVTGLFARLIGVCAAVNLSFLIACVMAAVTFYLVGRYHRWRWEWCLVGGTLFGLSSYANFRNVWHTVLIHYWHLPLCLLVCWWAGSRKGLMFRDRRYPIAVAIAVVTGFLNVYYINFFLQLLGLAVLSQLIRKSPRGKILAPATVMGVTFAAFLMASFDTLFYAARHGMNPNAFSRDYGQVEHYSLIPLDLLIPEYIQRWPLLRDLCVYYRAVAGPGHTFDEPVYLGVVGGISLMLLLATTVAGLTNRPVRASVLGLQAIWMIGYGMLGGLNCLIALSGFPLFHAMNRVSIMVLALSLFFFVRTLSRFTQRWPSSLCCGLGAVVILFGLADQNPRQVKKADIEKTRRQIEADKSFVQKMEGKLPGGAMVFQLPVMIFPEGGVRNRMSAGDTLRPYLWSRELHFSHGTCTGRGSDSWQLGLEHVPVPQLVQILERYGFAAVCINQRAYIDLGGKLLENFRAAGRAQVIRSQTNELACVFLQPSRTPVLPETSIIFAKGWQPMTRDAEGIFATWSKGNAAITIDNTTPVPLLRYMNFAIGSVRARTIAVSISNQSLWKTELKAGMWDTARDLTVTLPPGKTTVDFTTDTPSGYPGGNDPRKIAFNVSNFQLLETPSSAIPTSTPSP